MKKLTSLLLALSMIICACAIPGMAADPISPIQLLLVDALGWNTVSMETFRVALEDIRTGDKTVAEVVDADFLALIDNSASSQVVKDLGEAEVEAALTAFENAPATVTIRDVQEIYTKREFAPADANYNKTDAFPVVYNGVGGYVGDGLDTFIPLTGGINGYSFDNIRADINELITGDASNNNGLRFALLYMREEAFLNWKLGLLGLDETEIAVYNKSTGEYDFYLNDGIQTQTAKEYSVSSTNDLIGMIDSLNTAVSASDEDVTTQSVLGGNNVSGKFMTFVEDMLSYPAYDYEETFSFYKFLVDKKRQDEGIIILGIGVAPAEASRPTGSTVNSGSSVTLTPMDPADNVTGMKIYYTLDGTDPVFDTATGTCTNGYLYNSPITLTGNDGDTVEINAIVTKPNPEHGSDPYLTSMSKEFIYHINVPSGGGGVGVKTNVVKFESNGGTEFGDIKVGYGKELIITQVPERGGYIFDGWYLDTALTEKASYEMIVKGDICLYAKWVPATGHGGSIFTDDHFAYIVGYPDGTVKPELNVSREEAATVFFRLLTETVRNANITKSNDFTDVSDDRWSNTAVSTMKKMNIINGYEDGSFRPGNSITRAELAAIIARFDNTGVEGYSSFSDIDGHWAQDAISVAVAHGWITGYEDGTFRPDAYITRAEFVTMVNRVTGRTPETKDDLLEDMITWPDNPESAWYYVAVQEATNSHYYTAKPDSKFNKWTELRSARDWTELEK